MPPIADPMIQVRDVNLKYGSKQALFDVNLDMPAMTMVFQVKDPAVLEQVKAGDKVKFQAEKIGGGYRITRIAPAN